MIASVKFNTINVNIDFRMWQEYIDDALCINGVIITNNIENLKLIIKLFERDLSHNIIIPLTNKTMRKIKDDTYNVSYITQNEDWFKYMNMYGSSSLCVYEQNILIGTGNITRVDT